MCLNGDELRAQRGDFGGGEAGGQEAVETARGGGCGGRSAGIVSYGLSRFGCISGGGKQCRVCFRRCFHFRGQVGGCKDIAYGAVDVDSRCLKWWRAQGLFALGFVAFTCIIVGSWRWREGDV